MRGSIWKSNIFRGTIILNIKRTLTTQQQKDNPIKKWAKN
jgi:hypothetical protein